MSDDATAPEDVRLIATWYEDATAVAHALGVQVDLPDVGSTAPSYWAALDRKAWRDALKCKVAATDDEIDHGDPDWVLLKCSPGEPGTDGRPDPCDEIEVWFDLEEGVRFKFRVRSAARLRAILRQVAALDGLHLSDTWPGNVVAMPSVLDGSEDMIAPLMTAAGWRSGRHGIEWVMMP